MRRLRFNALIIVSLLLCIATLVFWVRSYGDFHDQFVWHSAVSKDNRQTGFSIDSQPGYLALWYEETVGGDFTHPGSAWYFRRHDPSRDGAWIRDLDNRPGLVGVAFRRADGVIREQGFTATPAVIGKYVSLHVSWAYWFIALVATIPVFAKIYFYKKTGRKRHQGLCPTCGYDLRATPERCPECGAVVTPIPS